MTLAASSPGGIKCVEKNNSRKDEKTLKNARKNYSRKEDPGFIQRVDRTHSSAAILDWLKRRNWRFAPERRKTLRNARKNYSRKEDPGFIQRVDRTHSSAAILDWLKRRNWRFAPERRPAPAPYTLGGKGIMKWKKRRGIGL